MNPTAAALAQDYAQAVLSHARPGEHVETFVQTAHTTKVEFVANKLRDADSREARGLAVRLRTADGRVGAFATSDFSAPDRVLEMARSLASLDEPYALEFPKGFAPTDVPTSYPSLEQLTPADLVADGTAAMARLQAGTPAGLHSLAEYRVLTQVELANSEGDRARWAHSEHHGYCLTELTRADDQLEAYEMFQSIGGACDHGPAVERLNQKIAWASKPATLASGTYPVLFTPNAEGTFMALSNALNGKPVCEGLSTFRDALGQQVLSPLITLVDDPTIPGAPMSYPLDDEGFPARRTVLVDKGVVTNFIYDGRYGALSGRGSTGNGLRCGRMTLGAGRSYQSSIMPAPANRVYSPGAKPVAELIKGIDRGVLVDSVMGVHTANPISGDFSVNLELAMVIDKGEIVGRLKDAMMAGNTFQMLSGQLAALSQESIWLGGSCCPYFLIEGVRIST